MSGTYQLGNPGPPLALFPKNPLTKRWQREQAATRGTGEPIYSAFWRLDLGFGSLRTQGDSDFFESRFISGGLYHAILPHPITGLPVGFTGVAIEDYQFTFTDVDRDYYAEGARLSLGHINLSATGTF